MARNILIVSVCMVLIFGLFILGPRVARNYHCKNWEQLPERDKIRLIISSDLSIWSKQISRGQLLPSNQSVAIKPQEKPKSTQSKSNISHSVFTEIANVANSIQGVEVKFYPPLQKEHFFIKFEDSKFLKHQNTRESVTTTNRDRPKLLAHVFYDKENSDDRKIMIQYEIHDTKQNLLSQAVKIHDLGKCL